MQSLLATLQTNKTVLKISACILSIALWSLVSSLHQHALTVTVPVCIYGEEEISLCGPETVEVTLRGSKKDLKAIDYATLAVHLDSSCLATKKNKPQPFTITAADMLLPAKITVQSIKPLNTLLQKK